jgi:hypothetical protein
LKAKCKRLLVWSFDLAFSVALLLLTPLIRLLARHRAARRQFRSLWGTTPILTLPLLSRVDHLLGFQSDSLVFETYYITQSFRYNVQPHLAALRRRAPWLLPLYYRLLFLWALFRYDVFHYFFDRGILEADGRLGVNRKELAWLRRSGKRLYLYAYGADVRTRSATEALGTYHCCLHCDAVGRHCLCDDREGQAKQARYRQSATAVVAMGDMTVYVPGARNLHYWPFDPAAVPLSGVTWDGKRPLKILHVPNHQWAKGSHYLRRALDRLREAGISFELLSLSRASNRRVLEVMQEADIVADQFLIGWHGYTALEAMACGKVVLCFIRDRSMLLRPDDCPIVNANPDNLERVLADLARSSPARLRELGLAGRRYVEQGYSPEAVAVRFAQLYLDTADFPPSVQGLIRARQAELAARLDQAPASWRQCA